ncbi:hypothetical protein QFW96_09960 [Saccharopolyspora sp. TS4A08]|uniref:LPXTG cell wall anchor domain-containing protein n=1 Tax=Saccharopolyspora ipomoeae TaxID=3042027 RepID=A0ABT6PLQ8_9PSEU|nr:hypothetical protein [Saccharopolyspora sp. TS4A08]MDI2028937.1 hypothetical protein [Saccharopolyspora sp. TS4A08]
MTDETTPYEGPDPILLVAGAIALIITATVALDLSSFLQWILAGVAVIVGVVLLVASLRRRAE